MAKYLFSISSPDQITVGQYVDFNDAKSKIKKASAATGMTVAEVQKLPHKVTSEIVKAFYAFIEECPVYQFEKIIEIDGQEYGFEPDLEKIQTAAFADLQHQEKQGLPTRLHKYLAILYRPVIQKWGNKSPKYRIEDYAQTGGDSILNADLFREMKLAQALGVCAFFLTLLNELTTALQTKMTAELKTAVKEMKAEVIN